MYLHKTPQLIRSLFPSMLWKLDASRTRNVYLTFDDGPIPGVTPWVLNQLDIHGAKATFFCVGDNVRKHPHVFHDVLESGHSVGNHTYHHLNGWNTGLEAYLKDVALCEEWVPSGLFRPPYGRVTPAQKRVLSQKFRIVMWDVLTGDFDPAISSQKCLHHIVQDTEAGSILVFHDSLKSFSKLKTVLPQALSYLVDSGFHLRAIPVEAPALSAVPA